MYMYIQVCVHMYLCIQITFPNVYIPYHLPIESVSHMGISTFPSLFCLWCECKIIML